MPTLLVDQFPSAVVTCGSALPVLARATRTLEATESLDRHRPTVRVGGLREQSFFKLRPVRVPIAAVGGHPPTDDAVENDAKIRQLNAQLVRTMPPRVCPIATLRQPAVVASAGLAVHRGGNAAATAAARCSTRATMRPNNGKRKFTLQP